MSHFSIEILLFQQALIIRPHPEYVKRFPARIKEIREKFASSWSENLVLETDFSSNETVYSADVLISDWSWIPYEFALATLKPVVFINTKMKVANHNWDKLPLTPLNLSLRGEIGVCLEKESAGKIFDAIKELLADKDAYRDRILKIRETYLFNFQSSGKAGGEYILSRFIKKTNQGQ